VQKNVSTTAHVGTVAVAQALVSVAIAKTSAMKNKFLNQKK
jgi:hypothetical protein